MTIRRAFLDLPDGQIHYRRAGEGPPVMLLHASPGSAKQTEPLISALAGDFDVIAPDTAGNGDSTPLSIASPVIADYAARIPALLDGLGVGRIDVYGSHTGAAIAAELAILHPERVGRLVLDGVGVFTPEERDRHLALYAHPFTPDVNGAHLLQAFHFCRDQYLFYPWYDRSREARRDGGVRPADELHAWVLEVLKAAETYHLAYRAAFAWDALDRLPRVAQPALLIAAEDDPLFACTRDAAPLIADGRFVGLPRFDAPDYSSLRKTLITDFLKG